MAKFKINKELVEKPMTEITRTFIQWTCPKCGYRNEHYWFGREEHICNECQERTDLK